MRSSWLSSPSSSSLLNSTLVVFVSAPNFWAASLYPDMFMRFISLVLGSSWYSIAYVHRLARLMAQSSLIHGLLPFLPFVVGRLRCYSFSFSWRMHQICAAHIMHQCMHQPIPAALRHSENHQLRAFSSSEPISRCLLLFSQSQIISWLSKKWEGGQLWIGWIICDWLKPSIHVPDLVCPLVCVTLFSSLRIAGCPFNWSPKSNCQHNIKLWITVIISNNGICTLSQSPNIKLKSCNFYGLSFLKVWWFPLKKSEIFYFFMRNVPFSK